MPGPRTAQHARIWIRGAIDDGRYNMTGHFMERVIERGFEMFDVMHALQKPERVEQFRSGTARHNGTLWRVTGSDIGESATIVIGLEAFHDGRVEYVSLITVFGGP